MGNVTLACHPASLYRENSLAQQDAYAADGVGKIKEFLVARVGIEMTDGGRDHYRKAVIKVQATIVLADANLNERAAAEEAKIQIGWQAIHVYEFVPF